ncbi:hypothetical protein FD724_27265 [Nostoc sp. C057]|uniref:hypothetical protein n=1 Tax=Nostoc sp. C057 TaxID=2576903 RepID=UPI0015C3A78B|nr:hypothetical protein [Nostoc sp. C057]QLE51412.1 hypothetical protein FD724_27265 [Nostoc sp. C057]
MDERSSEVDERSSEVDERSSEVDERSSEVDERSSDMDEWSSEVDERSSEVDERSSEVDELDFNSPLPPVPLLPAPKSRGWLFQSGFAKLTHIKFAIKYFQLATPED